LFSLGLGNNRLTGSIPNSLANINGLRLLTLGPNLLTGEFPNEIIENKFLFFLSVWGNQLEGPLPTGLIDVGLIDLRYNNFSGTIPEEYGVYSSIFGLRLDGNQLEGEIPNSIYASAGLSELSLRDNNLSGELSSSLNNFEDLDELYLDGNNFEGCAMDLDSLCNLVYNPNDTLVTYTNGATYNFKLGEGYDLTNNPKLPWSGDFQNYCNGESPIGASCDDGDSTTSNDVILDDCTCGMLSSNFDLGDRTVSIYPNPASDFIRIETSNPEGLIISLIDITGKKLNNLKLNATNEISNLESGIYIIQVLDTSGNILINDKLFIE
ncbi:MAG: T9SS type A sorting domain-containing protein, partial [Bacteroidia bacterium]|nr:T9SS type A sorting domain-containing protein [Bacteroidia bacterium]